MRAGSAREISIPFIAILTGGHGSWLAYFIGIANLPLIMTDSLRSRPRPCDVGSPPCASADALFRMRRFLTPCAGLL